VGSCSAIGPIGRHHDPDSTAVSLQGALRRRRTALGLPEAEFLERMRPWHDQAGIPPRCGNERYEWWWPRTGAESTTRSFPTAVCATDTAYSADQNATPDTCSAGGRLCRLALETPHGGWAKAVVVRRERGNSDRSCRGWDRCGDRGLGAQKEGIAGDWNPTGSWRSRARSPKLHEPRLCTKHPIMTS